MKLSDLCVAHQLSRGGGGNNQFAEIVQRTIVNASDKAATSIGVRAFSNCKSLVTVDFPNVTEISDMAFEFCNSLTEIRFPKAVNTGAAFDSCSSLISVDFPNATKIDAYAFKYCNRLKNVNFPSVTEIDNYAFEYCNSLVKAEFPSLTKLAHGAFYKCNNFASLILHKRVELPSATSVPFPNVTTVYVEDADLEWYSTASGWSTIYANGRIKPISELPSA